MGISAAPSVEKGGQRGSCSGSFSCLKNGFPPAVLLGPSGHVPIITGSAASGWMFIQLFKLCQAFTKHREGPSVVPALGTPACNVLRDRTAPGSRALPGVQMWRWSSPEQRACCLGSQNTHALFSANKGGSFPRDAAPWALRAPISLSSLPLL